MLKCHVFSDLCLQLLLRRLLTAYIRVTHDKAKGANKIFTRVLHVLSIIQKSHQY